MQNPNLVVQNSAQLPLFRINGRSWSTRLRTSPPLTRLVDTRRQRHSYVVNMEAPEEEVRGLMNWVSRKAVARRLDEFVCHVARQVQGRPLGYLMRINAVTDPQGVPFPSEHGVFTEIGFGTEPADALANVIDRLPPRPREGAMDASYYLWYTCQHTDIEPTRFDGILSTWLENDARAEADRRRILGEFIRAGGAQGIERAQVAEYWKDVATRRNRIWESAEVARRSEEIQARLAAAQEQFNAAYANFQTVSREMANNAAEMQGLEKIASVLSVIQAGTQAIEDARAWREARQRSLQERQLAEKQRADATRGNLQQAQDAAQANWQQRGYPDTPPAPIPDVPPANPFPVNPAPAPNVRSWTEDDWDIKFPDLG